jgi:Tfp pilus assembly protein PilF
VVMARSSRNTRNHPGDGGNTMRICFFLSVLLASLPLCAISQRQALVIGNDSYPDNSLSNARNDAKAVADSLSSLGYATTLKLDVDRKGMIDAVSTFSDGLKPGDTVVLYYAGHGFQVDGENYLVPIDFKVRSPEDAKHQGYSLSGLLDKLISHGATTQVVILDACRNNPFLATRSLRGGWAGTGTSAGTFLAFGTSPGSTASDDPGDSHGLFTKDLLKHLTTSPLDVEQMFQEVRQDVISDSKGLQVPWTASSLIGTLHMDPRGDATTQLLKTGLPVLNISNENAVSGRTVTPIPPANQVTPISPVGQIIPVGPVNPVRPPVNPIGIGVGSSTAQVEQALLFAQGQQYDQAVRCIKAVLDADPRSALALRVLGLIFHLMGRDANAIEDYSRAITLNPRDATAFYYRCLAQSTSNPTAAVQDCKRAIAARPDLAEAHLGLANAWFALGLNESAYLEADTMIRLAPASPLGYAMRGRISATMGQVEEAEQDYQTASNLNK